MSSTTSHSRDWWLYWVSWFIWPLWLGVEVMLSLRMPTATSAVLLIIGMSGTFGAMLVWDGSLHDFYWSPGLWSGEIHCVE